MAKKPTLTTITSGFASNTQINANFEALREALDNTISRDGSVPNSMTADLDLNGKNLLNIGDVFQGGVNLTEVINSAVVSAQLAEANAQASETAADLSATNAATSATSANNAASYAYTQATAASSSASNAGLSAASAYNSSTSAAASATSASTSASAASASETDSAASALSASSSATSAAASSTSASSSASNASTSASNAATSASSAAISATNAATSATSASTSATNAALSETNAAASEAAAASSASSAASSASSASTDAASAAASATSAATSATNSAASATAAATSETNAATSASQAATSATNAATSETNAATSASDAAASAALAATYGAGGLQIAANLSDLDNVVTARANLGVEIGVDVQAYNAGTVVDATYVHTDNNYTTTEKSKLAGIEAGATADQTASEILTAIKTVDGSGSGLDADLLDGNHASAFATAAQGTLAASAVQPNSSPTFNVVTATSYSGDGSNLTGISAGATGGGTDQIFYENGQTVTTNYTITTGKNAMSAGPITINSGVTVTVGSGETWTVV